MTQLASRTPDIDIDKCAENVGGKMSLIVIAAQRARDLRAKSDRHGAHRNFATEALLDIQAGKVNSDYMAQRVLTDSDETNTDE